MTGDTRQGGATILAALAGGSDVTRAVFDPGCEDSSSMLSEVRSSQQRTQKLGVSDLQREIESKQTGMQLGETRRDEAKKGEKRRGETRRGETSTGETTRDVVTVPANSGVIHLYAAHIEFPVEATNGIQGSMGRSC